MKSKTYMNKANRDIEAKILKNLGYVVKKSSSRKQLLHPMYVEDYPRVITEAEKGFGNTIYKTFFAVLYHVEAQ